LIILKLHFKLRVQDKSPRQMEPLLTQYLYPSIKQYLNPHQHLFTLGILLHLLVFQVNYSHGLQSVLVHHFKYMSLS